jgi:hypothetical protein
MRAVSAGTNARDHKARAHSVECLGTALDVAKSKHTSSAPPPCPPQPNSALMLNIAASSRDSCCSCPGCTPPSLLITEIKSRLFGDCCSHRGRAPCAAIHWLAMHQHARRRGVGRRWSCLCAPIYLGHLAHSHSLNWTPVHGVPLALVLMYAINIIFDPNQWRGCFCPVCHGAVVLHLATFTLHEDHNIRSKGRCLRHYSLQWRAP